MARKKRGVSESAETARELLSQNANRMTVIGSLLVWMMSLAIYYFLFSGIGIIATLFYLDTGVPGFLLLLGYFVLALLYTQFAVLPLLWGVMQIAHGMARGEEVPLADIFLPFSQKKDYRRAVRLAGGWTWRALLAVALGSLACSAAILLLENGAVRFLACLGIVVTVLFLYLFLGRRRFWMAALLQDCPNAPKRALRRRMKLAHAASPGAVFRYLLYFIPRILLGIATLGIYLLAEVLPLMLLTYFCECNKTLDLIKRLEEHKDHE